MMICRRRNNATARRALQETYLQQIGLVYILNGLALFAYRSGDGIQPNRPAPEGADHGLQHLMVDTVQSPGVHLEHLQRFGSNLRGDDSVAPDLGVIAYPLQ